MRGGRRQGSGRPKGAKTKRTSEIAKAAAAEGITPLEYMLQILRNPAAAEPDKRWAAEKAAPYVHARLNSVDLTGRLSVEDLTDEQLEAKIERLTAAEQVH